MISTYINILLIISSLIVVKPTTIASTSIDQQPFQRNRASGIENDEHINIHRVKQVIYISKSIKHYSAFDSITPIIKCRIFDYCR